MFSCIFVFQINLESHFSVKLVPNQLVLSGVIDNVLMVVILTAVAVIKF